MPLEFYIGFLLWICSLFFILTASYIQRQVVPYPDILVDDDGEYVIRLDQDISSGTANTIYLLLVATASIRLPVFVLAVISFFFLAIAAIQDWKINTANSLHLLIIVICSIAIGSRTGHLPSAIGATLIIILYEILLGDPDEFGSADLMVCMAALAGFGFCAWPIFLFVSSMVALILKLIFWLSKKHELKNHGVAFLPSLFVGAVLALIIDLIFGDYYTIPFSELIWLFKV